MFALIRECEGSDLSQEKFVKHHGISKSTFGYWRKKYQEETGANKRKDNLIPIKVSNATEKHPDVLEIVYPNGVRLVCSPCMDISRLKPLIVL